jgi:hypothetical protein
MVVPLNDGCRVEGNYGPFEPNSCNPNGTQVKRQKWQQIEGMIVESWGEKKWLIKFKNVEAKECLSTGLRLLSDPRFSSSTAVPVLTAPSRGVPVLVVTAAAPSIAVPMLTAAAPSTADPLMAMDGVVPFVSAPVMTMDKVAPSVSAPVMVTGDVVPSLPAPVMAINGEAVPSVSALVMATDEVAAPSVSAPALENTDGTAEPDDDLDAVDLAEQSEEVMEESNEEDSGFDVVENITSDAYQQQRQECEATKLQRIPK